jgi:predicted nucleotidyltransferase
MTRTIDLQQEDLAILLAVLRGNLSSDTDVFVFGSRATGAARRYSDIDLALRGDRPLDGETLGRLRDALSASDLTIKVDLVDLRAVDPSFLQIIESEMVALLVHGGNSA